MKKQYLKLFSAVLAFSGIGVSATAQSVTLGGPRKLPIEVGLHHALRVDIPSLPLGDTLKVNIHAAASVTFSLAISDTSGILQTLTVTGGSTSLPALSIGKYRYTLTDTSGTVVASGNFAVKAPHVRAEVRSVTLGDSLFIEVAAPTSTSFTLAISDTGGVVQTLAVTGGTTALPSLPIGWYSFTLTNGTGIQVSSGKFFIKAPHVNSSVRSGVWGDTLAIWVGADMSSSFSLAVSDTSGVVQTLTVLGGKTNLPTLAIGRYSYTLTNAAGIIVSKGVFEVRAPHVNSLVRSGVWGDTLAIWVAADTSTSFSLAISDTSGVIQTLTVSGGSTKLPVLGIGRYRYSLTNAAGIVVGKGFFEVRAPHVNSLVRSGILGDTLAIWVGADTSTSFTLAISDTSGVLQTLTVSGGNTDLPVLGIGRYSYTLTNAAGIEVSKGFFEVRAPHVNSLVRSGVLGDTLAIWVEAKTTESFTLAISDTAAVVQTLTVMGGSTDLPVLGIGRYRYTLTNAAGIVVSQGFFEVRAPHVHAAVTFNRFNEALTLLIAAPNTETFTLTVKDSSGAAVRTLSVTGGFTVLDSLPRGTYTFALVNADGIQVAQGQFEVKSPLVHSAIYPNPSVSGTGSIILNAPDIEAFTLVIYDGTATPIYTGVVHGGSTLLPDTLSAGLFHYRVVNSGGSVVSQGKILILL